MKNKYNEMYTDHGAIRKIYGHYLQWLKGLPEGTLERINIEAELLLGR